MRFRFIEEHQRVFPVRAMCRVLKVSPSGYYAWRSRPRSRRSREDRRLQVLIRAIYRRSRCSYGAPRIHVELVEQVQERIFVHSPSSPGLERTFSFRFRCRESLSDKARFCLQRVVIPDALDFQFLRLPAFLSFLYFVIRPIRLLAKHVPSALNAPFHNE